MIKLSKPGKMPCKSWSLQAVETCPGALASDGGLVDACKGCYATTGNYRFPNVKAPRLHNRDDWTRAAWVDDMTTAINGASHFRWFDSGDMYSHALAVKILQVMRNCANTVFWLPTRMHKFLKFKNIIKRMNALPNCVVRRSSDSITGGTVRGTSSTIFDPAMGAPDGAVSCGAYKRDGKCGDCRACWDKSITVIAYPQHGQQMARVNRDLIAIG